MSCLGDRRAVWNMFGPGYAQTVYIFHPYVLALGFLLWWCSPLCHAFFPASFHISWHERCFPCLKTKQSYWWSLWNNSSSLTPGSGSTSVILTYHGKARAGELSHLLLSSLCPAAWLGCRGEADIHSCWAPSVLETPGEMQYSALLMLATQSSGPIWHLI